MCAFQQLDGSCGDVKGWRDIARYNPLGNQLTQEVMLATPCAGRWDHHHHVDSVCRAV
jgi:hypothetical protein